MTFKEAVKSGRPFKMVLPKDQMSYWHQVDQNGDVFMVLEHGDRVYRGPYYPITDEQLEKYDWILYGDVDKPTS